MSESLSDGTSDSRAFHSGAALASLPGRTQIELSGADRATFLQALTTNHIKALEPGQGCETFLCNVQGKTIGHGFLFCTPETLIFDTTPKQASGLLQHLDRYLFREKVVLRDRSDDWVEFVLAGPRAMTVLEQCGVAAIPAARCEHVAAKIAGFDVSLRRVDYVSGDCFLLSTDASHADTLISALTLAGAVSVSGMALDAARIAAGTPLFGVDITADNLPQEVARNQLAISFVKGCYLGQETVARLDALGHVNRLLVRLRFPGSSTVPAAGMELGRDGKVVGHVTSSAWSESLQAPIALAYLRRVLVVADTDGWVSWER